MYISSSFFLYFFIFCVGTQKWVTTLSLVVFLTTLLNLSLNKSQLVQGRYDLVVLVCRMVFSSLLGSRNGRKVVVSSGNSKRKHISNFLSTPYKHDVPKLVCLHLYDYAKLSYFTNLIIVLFHLLNYANLSYIYLS